MTTKPTLILGATGKTGRRVAERLTARRLPLRAASRTGVPPFNRDNRRTWTSALDGVGAAYITSYPTWRSQARPRQSASSRSWQ